MSWMNWWREGESLVVSYKPTNKIQVLFRPCWTSGCKNFRSLQITFISLLSTTIVKTTKMYLFHRLFAHMDNYNSMILYLIFIASLVKHAWYPASRSITSHLIMSDITQSWHHNYDTCTKLAWTLYNQILVTYGSILVRQ